MLPFSSAIYMTLFRIVLAFKSSVASDRCHVYILLQDGLHRGGKGFETVAIQRHIVPAVDI